MRYNSYLLNFLHHNILHNFHNIFSNKLEYYFYPKNMGHKAKRSSIFQLQNKNNSSIPLTLEVSQQEISGIVINEIQWKNKPFNLIRLEVVHPDKSGKDVSDLQ